MKFMVQIIIKTNNETNELKGQGKDKQLPLHKLSLYDFEGSCIWIIRIDQSIL